MTMKTVQIDLGNRGYDISIGENLFNSINDFLPFSLKGKKAFLVTDENVAPYAQDLKETILKLGASFCDVLILPSGEATKSYDHLHQVHNWLLENNIHRNSVVFAVGGGVIGDLAGFAASTVLRGVPYVQVPTTILSQVDSSVGGKTGINTSYGKNLIGNFYQPSAVIADIQTLKTLPKREVLAGYAEVVKYGLLGDAEFFKWLEKNGQFVVNLDPDMLMHAIELSCKAKAAIVEADELESGKRALLNLGHTFGHALEAVMGYDGSLLHGEGVSIGTVMAFDLSVRLGVCPEDDLNRVIKHFKDVGLPTHASQISVSDDRLIDIMRRDKKALDDKMVFILVNRIGDAYTSNDVPERLVRDVLNSSLSGGNI